MGDEIISSDTKSDAQALAELEQEFERELKRNQLALQLLRERAEEAQIAKSRAELSAQKKECMMTKLNQLKENMAATNETLTKAQERINKQEQIRAMVTSMQDKVNKYAEKLNMQKQNSQQLMIVGDCNPDFDFPEPLINYDEEDEKEKQQQQQKNSENLVEGPTFEILKEDDKVAQIPEEPQQVQQNFKFNKNPLMSNTKKTKAGKIDYAQTVLDLQEKLSRTVQVQISSSSQQPNESKQCTKGESCNVATDSASSTSWQSKSDQEPDHEINETHTDLNESVQRLESKCVGARSEEALNIDLNESVQRLEAKCAGVREELGNMALSEQYMRTKQAQLRARKKELEAKQATIKAELREKEAADMRVKVEGMMKLLAERRNKLKITETVIVKKGNVVDNVNKILNQKEIRAKQKEKQKDELLAFGKKPQK